MAWLNRFFHMSVIWKSGSVLLRYSAASFAKLLLAQGLRRSRVKEFDAACGPLQKVQEYGATST